MISRFVILFYLPEIFQELIDKARLASTTAWIASPAETVALLDELEEHEKALPIPDALIDG